MPRKPSSRSPKTPGYRRLRRKTGNDLAFVEINGKRLYLGRYDAPESRADYHRLVAEWQAGGGRLPVAKGEITVLELILQFRDHALLYSRKPDGTPTGEFENFRVVLRPLRELYGRTLAKEFGPRGLKAIRWRR